jgi:hypothetical protein
VKDFRPQPFRQLVKVLREMGYSTDARKIAIEEHDILAKRALTEGKHFEYLLRILFRWTLGYGFLPQKILIPTFILWLLCAVMYIQADVRGGFIPTSPELFLKGELSECRSKSETLGPKWVQTCFLDKYIPEYQSFNAFAYSAEVLLHLVSFRQEEFWQPKPRKDGWLSWLRAFIWLERLWGLGVIVVVTFYLNRVLGRD